MRGAFATGATAPTPPASAAAFDAAAAPRLAYTGPTAIPPGISKRPPIILIALSPEIALIA